MCKNETHEIHYKQVKCHPGSWIFTGDMFTYMCLPMLCLPPSSCSFAGHLLGNIAPSVHLFVSLSKTTPWFWGFWGSNSFAPKEKGSENASSSRATKKTSYHMVETKHKKTALRFSKVGSRIQFFLMGLKTTTYIPTGWHWWHPHLYSLVVGGWTNPFWKILVNMEHFHQVRNKIKKNIWNHHHAIYI